MNDGFYKQLIDESLTGYAYYRIIYDEEGNLEDFKILEINSVYASLLGIKSADIIGKKTSEIIPGKNQIDFIQLKHFGEIAVHKGTTEYEQYSDVLKKWYRVTVYSFDQNYLVTHYIDISIEKEQIKDMQWLFKASERLLNVDETGVDYETVAYDFLSNCQAEYAIFNLFDVDKEKFTTMAITGDVATLERIIDIFGYEIIGKQWEYNPVYTESLKKSAITRLSSLKELVEGFIQKSVIAMVEKMFSLGEVVLIRIAHKNVVLGDLTLLMPKGVKFDKDAVVEIYTKQLGIAIERERAINKQKNLEKQLLSEREWFRTTLLSIGECVIAFDNEEKVLIMNHPAELLTGYKLVEAKGEHVNKVFNIVDEKSKRIVKSPVIKVLESGGLSVLDKNTVLISKTKKEWPIEADAAPIKDQNNHVIGVVLVFREITEKRKQQKEIEYISFHDNLTRLYNRHFFEEELQRLNTKRNLPLTLMMVDVNGLKLTNDTFGHKAGDELLKKVASGMKKECRADDIIARVGGDEFVVILPKTDFNEAKILAKRIVAKLFKMNINSLPISISLGFDTKKEMSQDIESVLKNAEDSLYNHKLTESTSMHTNFINMIMQTLNELEDGNKEHAQQVSEWCTLMGLALKMDQASISNLTTVGLMHDIGNIAIDSSILNKPGLLKNSEWEEIKRHPEIGFRILSSVNDLAPLAKIVLAHHEKWDGTGYPKGLKGVEIPLESRIIALVDAYDAMISDRPYRKAMSKEKAADEISINAGTQFDPELAQIFLKIINE